MEWEELRGVVSKAVEGVLTEHVHEIKPSLGMPLLSDWVLVVSVDDVADNTKGATVSFNPVSQWAHRSVGLLTLAADNYRHITAAYDDED